MREKSEIIFKNNKLITLLQQQFFFDEVKINSLLKYSINSTALIYFQQSPYQAINILKCLHKKRKIITHFLQIS